MIDFDTKKGNNIMMIAEFIGQLHELGISLWVEGNKLRYSAPKAVLTADLRAELVKHKSEIIAFFEMMAKSEQNIVERLEKDEQIYVAPRTEDEQKIAEIWSQALGVEKVGIHDNFFDLGGDSLLVLQVTSKCNQVGLQFAPMQITKYQTIAELATVKGTTFIPLEEPTQVSGQLHLTIAQRCNFERDYNDLQHFNVAMIWEVYSPLNPDLLSQALQLVMNHHDALRSRFIFDKKDMTAYVGASEAPIFSYIDISEMPPHRHKSAIESIGNNLHLGMNLSDGPLFKFVLINLGNAYPQRLLIVLHHFIFDEVSFLVILNDFYAAYDSLCHQLPVRFPPKTISIQQWTERLSAYARSTQLHQEMLDYWLPLPWDKIPSLPLDYPENIDHNTINSQDYVSISFDSDETYILMTETPKYHIGVRDALLMALVRSLTRWSGGRYTIINEINSGRYAIPDAYDVDLSQLVGWLSFTGCLVFEQIETDNPLKAILEIRRQLLDIPNNGLGYELLLYASESSETMKKLKRSFDYDILFNFTGGRTKSSIEDGAFQQARKAGVFKPAHEDGGMLQRPHQHPYNKRCNALYCSMSISGNQLVTQWEYSSNIHKRTTIEEVAHDFKDELQELISYLRDNSELRKRAFTY